MPTRSRPAAWQDVALAVNKHGSPMKRDGDTLLEIAHESFDGEILDN